MERIFSFLEERTERRLTRRRQEKEYEKSRRHTVLGEIWSWVDALIFAIFWVIIINQYLFQLFVIPSPSMVATLNVGDRVIVNKDSYGVELYPAGTKAFTDGRRVQRDEIITFYNPEYDSKGPFFDILSQVIYMGTLTLVNIDRNPDGTPAERLYVKRAVGMPGDIVDFREGDAWIELAGTDGFIPEAEFRKEAGLVDGPSRSVDRSYYPGLRAAGRLTAYQEAGLGGQAPLHTIADYQRIIGSEYDWVFDRYELERAFMHGELEARDLPAAWKELYKKYLGVDVPDDRSGVLQDSHWSGGQIGYFPSYALGSAYGAQLVAKMKETVDVDECVAAGDLAPISQWLEERIWRHGRLYKPTELIENAMGAPFDPKFYTDYLEAKMAAVYRF